MPCKLHQLFNVARLLGLDLLTYLLANSANCILYIQYKDCGLMSFQSDVVVNWNWEMILGTHAIIKVLFV